MADFLEDGLAFGRNVFVWNMEDASSIFHVRFKTKWKCHMSPKDGRSDPQDIYIYIYIYIGHCLPFLPPPRSPRARGRLLLLLQLLLLIIIINNINNDNNKHVNNNNNNNNSNHDNDNNSERAVDGVGLNKHAGAFEKSYGSAPPKKN